MLFLLTGEVRIGKTRWLERLVADLYASGASVAGVLAPGVWVPSAGPRADKNGFEKLGIDNVLLPSGERVRLACRRDLAAASRTLEEDSQSERAGLGWAMTDGAIKQVDAHFAWLAEDEVHGLNKTAAPGLLIADELGRLELLRGEGLVHAIELLARGPRPHWPHVLAVVRRDLLPYAHKRFDIAWNGEVKEISPTESDAARLRTLFAAIA